MTIKEPDEQRPIVLGCEAHPVESKCGGAGEGINGDNSFFQRILPLA